MFPVNKIWLQKVFLSEFIFLELMGLGLLHHGVTVSACVLVFRQKRDWMHQMTESVFLHPWLSLVMAAPKLVHECGSHVNHHRGSCGFCLPSVSHSRASSSPLTYCRCVCETDHLYKACWILRSSSLTDLQMAVWDCPFNQSVGHLHPVCCVRQIKNAHLCPLTPRREITQHTLKVL